VRVLSGRRGLVLSPGANQFATKTLQSFIRRSKAQLEMFLSHFFVKSRIAAITQTLQPLLTSGEMGR